jgi:hypothetical protein
VVGGFRQRAVVPVTNERERASVRAGLGALACAAFVAVAIAAEVIGGLYANSSAPALSERVFPITWPRPARVAWWLAVGAAALGYRLILHRIGIRQRAWVAFVSVAPFVVFAVGVAVGADWARWH